MVTSTQPAPRSGSAPCPLATRMGFAAWVLVNGRVAPVVGRVTMDQIMVQLDGVPHAKAGDEVVLIGHQGEAHISAEEVAETWGTINYEVVCAIGSRVPRFYKSPDELLQPPR